MKSCKYTLNGLDCASCAKKIEDKIASVEGYYNVNVNFSTLKLSFQTEKSDVDKEIKDIIYNLEPEVEVIKDGQRQQNKAERNSADIIRLIIGVWIYFIGIYFGGTISTLLTMISLIILLSRIVPKAYIQLIKNKTLDENALITISAIGACFVNKATEGIMVITLYEIGKILEARAVNRTRKSITELMNIKPQFANLKINDEIKEVNPEEVKIGDIIIVKSGEKIPLDGKIIKGEAEIDNSALTGESKLISVYEGEKVLSGGINAQGLIEIQVEKNYENSTVNQILNLVENATDKKAKTETFVAKITKVYTPLMFVLAFLVAVFMPLIIKNVTYNESIYKALIFLVISCPCSIAISVPLSYFCGIGKASKKGILIKGSDYLDGAKDIGQIIFDKTGTITTGEFIVTKVNILNDGYTESEILKYFAIGEKFSNHPIAKSILKKAENTLKGIDLSEIQNFEEITGKGLKYNYKGKNIKIGNQSFINYTELVKTEGTVLYLKIDDDIVGNIVLEDEIKKEAKDAVKTISKMGIKTKMFTGDKKEVAEKISKEIGINEVRAEMMPQDKYKELEKIIKNNKSSKKVAFVGDGINDSPVLARSDIGISMGGIGSNSAIEASDIVIMTDDLEKIVETIDISKRTDKIIKQNLMFAIGIKILILALSLFGIADMWEAVFADVGTTLITVFNTLRIF